MLKMVTGYSLSGRFEGGKDAIDAVGGCEEMQLSLVEGGTVGGRARSHWIR